MQNYTAPLRRRRLAVTMLGAAAALFCAGCAQQPPTPAVSDSAPADAAAAQDDSIRPANDIDEATRAAGDLSLRHDAPLRYTVKKGDTLWGIASYFLRDPWQWPQLWYENTQVRNPHLIYPGETLTLVMVDGRPRLADVSEHLHPQVREEPLDAALPAIPLDAIRNFLRGPRLVTEDEIDGAPYVLEYTGEHIDGGANDGIYVRNLPEHPAPTWAVVQIGDEYRDPDSGERLGFEALPAGQAELRTPGKTSEFLITQSSREVLIGDRLLPVEKENFDANFYPHPPPKPVDGRIISVFDSVTEIPQYQIVALNRGSKAGLDPGTVLAIYQSGRVVADPYGNSRIELPEQYAGLLMVFKTTSKLSYALVMSANRPAHVYDKVHQPAATRG